jgi:hypothetical protein
LLNIITYFKRIKRRYEKIREKEWEKKKREELFLRFVRIFIFRD